MKEIRKRGCKYRIYPNAQQALLINKTFGAVRKIYNLLLDERNTVYERYKDSPELLKKYIYKTPAHYKTIYPYLKEVDSQALSSTSNDLTNAFNSYFNKIHKHPKFKSKYNSRQSYTSHTTHGNIML